MRLYLNSRNEAWPKTGNPLPPFPLLLTPLSNSCRFSCFENYSYHLRAWGFFVDSSGEDKLALFRQQATIIAHKKEATADQLRSRQAEVDQMTDAVKVKKETLGSQRVKVGGYIFSKMFL